MAGPVYDDKFYAFKKEVNNFDISLGATEGAFCSILAEPEEPNWAKRVCDLYDHITNTKDNLILRTKQAKTWYLPEPKELLVGVNDKKEDPERRQRYKQKEKERYERRKKEGKIKLAENMGPREKRITRRRWKINQRNKRSKDKAILTATQNIVTPPLSPENENEERNGDRRAQVMREVGRKRMRRDRSKAYRTINKLRVKLFQQQKLKSKYKMRCSRLQKEKKSSTERKVENIIQRNETKKALLVFQSVLDRTRERYLSTKSTKERQKISTLVVSAKVLRRLRLTNFCKSLFGFSRRHLKEPKTKNKYPPRTLKMVRDFLERDDNSRMKTGKKSKITRKGQQRQIRLLSDSLKNLHGKFLLEYRVKILYSLFCSFKPFHIMKPTLKDRETCLCKLHENLRFKINRCYSEKAIPANDEESLLKRVTCDVNSKACMYRECNTCKNKEITISDEVESGKQTWWYIWKNQRVEKEKNIGGKIVKSTVSVTTKEKESGTLQILSEELNKDVQKATRHFFNIKHQYKTLRYLRDNLTHEEIVLHIDFSENYNCKYSKEIQSMHFGASQCQISLHTGVAYAINSTYSFCTISDCLSHGPSSIWAHLHPVIKDLLQKTHATKMHFISDGPTTQYRNKQNFYLLSTLLFDYGVEEASWNFLEAGHGKGAADGIGAVVKRTADGYVNNGGDVNCASDMMKALEGTSVSVYEITEEAIQAIESSLPTTLKPIPNTMKIHQVLVSSTTPGKIKSRVLSCFCKKPIFACTCFAPTTSDFPFQREQVGPLISVVAEAGTSDSDILPEPVESRDTLTKIQVVDESLLSKHCVVKYDDHAYPGIILDVDDDEEVEVKTMHNIGRNRFFWPLLPDILWYAKENILTLLHEPPKLVTKRHHQIDPKIWSLIEKEIE